MKKADLLKKYKNLFPKLYSFSYSIIQDDLQATQITIDALTGYSWEEKESVKGLLEIEDYSEFQRVFYEMELALYKIIFQLAAKREKHLNFKTGGEGNIASDFFKLTILDRAILYLKYKRELEFEEIENILGLKRHQVINFLNLAKKSFLNSNEDNLTRIRA